MDKLCVFRFLYVTFNGNEHYIFYNKIIPDKYYKKNRNKLGSSRGLNPSTAKTRGERLTNCANFQTSVKGN